MQKTIYSLLALRELLEAANRRYLEFLSAVEDPRAGRNKLDKLSQPVEQEGRRYSGFNLFDPDDETCSVPLSAASSTSADCRTKRFVATWRNAAAARCRACSNDSAHTGSSRRSATLTSTTSLPSAKKSLPPPSNSESL
jgi:hypothetical protein